MKILITNFISMFDSCNVALLEQIKIHQQLEDEIYVLVCNSDMMCGCGNNFYKNLRLCRMCKSNHKKWIRVLDLKEKINFLKIPEFSISKNIKDQIIVDDIAMLKSLKYNQYDIGAAIASTLISDYRNSEPEILADELKQINEYYDFLISYIEYLDDQIKKYQFDKAYIYNGRGPLDRMTLRVCQNNRLKVNTLVMPIVLNQYRAIEDEGVHNLSKQKEMIECAWKKSNDYNFKERESIRFIEQYRKGKVPIIRDFLEKQKTNNLPLIDDSKLNIGIYISSEDEMETIEGWKNPIYKNQNDAVEQLIKQKNIRKSAHFFIRIHPNLRGCDNVQTKFLNNIKLDNTTVIKANSKVSSYELIQHMDIVISYGTSVGIEACYDKKTVILAGRALYEDLPGVLKPKSHHDLCDIINKYPNIDTNKEEAYNSSIKYFWFLLQGGEDLKYFKILNNLKVVYLGEKSIWLYIYSIKDTLNSTYRGFRRFVGKVLREIKTKYKG